MRIHHTAALVATLLTATAAGCSPYTVERELDGVNAKNYPGVVVIDPDTEFRAAVWAQEYYEAKRKGHPFGLALVRLDTSEQRDMELIGHEIETQVAVRLYQQDEAEYRRREARALKNAYGDLFKKSDVDDVQAQMLGRREYAVEWVDDNWSRIKEQM